MRWCGSIWSGRLAGWRTVKSKSSSSSSKSSSSSSSSSSKRGGGGGVVEGLRGSAGGEGGRDSEGAFRMGDWTVGGRGGGRGSRIEEK